VTPQGNLMVLATVTAGRESELRTLLASMNRQPGVVDPDNALVPFRRLDRIHFARFVILDDRTLDDITIYKLQRVDYPLSVAFIADFDGPQNSFIDELERVAGSGLSRIFACCGFGGGDLKAWMKEHRVKPAANYVNTVGRTMLEVREEAALRDFICTYLRGAGAPVVAKMTPAQVRQTLRELVKSSGIKLTPPAPTPIGWRISQLINFITGLLFIPLAILFLPILIPLGIIYLIILRLHETTDAEVDRRAAPDVQRKLAEIEDHDVTNQFSAMGSLKPGWFRLLNISIGLVVINWTARHIFTRGHLGRVQTIHFARWVYLNDRKRLYFASNYDGSLDSYMDDFINKVGFGLNLVFSNGIGYPRTNYLVFDGAKDEQKFKRYIRRHQLPTEVWYDAHPGRTAVDLARNTRIREGLERSSMSDAETRQWLQLF
jgi:hypothetical protein